MDKEKIKHLLNEEFHDACGIGFVAELNGTPGRRVIDLSVQALKRMSHRGAAGADDQSGDGSGILVDIPQNYFRKILKEEMNYECCENEQLGIAMVFTSKEEFNFIEGRFRSIPVNLKLKYIGKRIVPVNKETTGEIARKSCPEIIQFFVAGNDEENYSFGCRLFILRKMIEKEILERKFESFICSFSSKTIIYKGLLRPGQLARFYHDLNDPEFKVRISMFHDRFSTNTVSSWSMAQPFRMLAHNGEINTIKGNRLWMKTREETINSDFWKEYIPDLKPIVSQTGSDSFSLDNILEFLVHSGKSLYESILMLIPDPYEGNEAIDESLRDFFIFNENFIEPWDGPAALVFTDGSMVGAKLDRNGLRPLRYSVTKDGLIVMASEAGVIDIDAADVVVHHHMSPGDYFAFKLDGSGLISNFEIKKEVSREGHYTNLLKDNLVKLVRGNEFEEFGDFALPAGGFDKRLRKVFGLDCEDLDKFILPMAATADISTGSTGDDTPQAFMSKKQNKFYHYFKQAFAQVTNPPIDPIREKHVINLSEYIGSEAALFTETEVFNGAIRIESPVLSPREVKELGDLQNSFQGRLINCNFHLDEKIECRLEKIFAECESAVNSGSRLLFLSDEGVNEQSFPIPMLLVVAAVHQHLVNKKLRNSCALICFTGDVVEDHDVACLVGFGASAVYPYMAYEIIREHSDDSNVCRRMANYRLALEKGLTKIMARMGVSTIASYRGSMLFHSLGLSAELIEKYFPFVKNSIGFLTLEKLKSQITANCKEIFEGSGEIQDNGRYSFKIEGELHGFSPAVFKTIQGISTGKANKSGSETGPVYIRDYFEFKSNGKVNIGQVESGDKILKRFGFGAISFGAISDETHRMLAKAAAQKGLRSNTGEGGEQKDRYSITNPDQSENCFVKQVASGRFGVTTSYLVAAREIQIKMAQGAKPGEGGQLPGKKVTIAIANARYTSPGVDLISPPPHHDIYSIEDIAQLIYDLREVNPRATISVKLVSQFGIGIVASGVVKAGADVILLSGGDGGTGASPLGSIKHSGMPWEIGLAEVHSTLVASGLRERVTLRVDGGIKNARDIITASLLGAEEWDIGTAALVALGCVMCRKCNLNSCPVGIATQDAKLRKNYKGSVDGLLRFLESISGDVRTLLSEIGFYSIEEIIGRTDLLQVNKKYENEIKILGIDLESFLDKYIEHKTFELSNIKFKATPVNRETNIDESIIEEVRSAITTHGRAIVKRKIDNTNRAVGTRLSGLISFLHGPAGFKGNIQFILEGAAGQSLGAFLIDNVELRLKGVANDFVGKGMSGGVITVRFPRSTREDMENNTIIGNVALYGATGGELFCAGRAGERFAVRNSGATAVVEGVGNNCCEYMTRGLVIVLGETGRNFGAGMTGGMALLYSSLRNNNFSNLNKDYVRLENLNPSEETLLLKILRNHNFHTGSTIAKKIIEKWIIEKNNFVKVIPRACDNIDYNELYDKQFQNRQEMVFS